MTEENITWENAVLWLKSQNDCQQLVKDCYYDDPLIDSVKRYYNSTEWNEVRTILKNEKKGKVLDIGAGRGISSYSFAKDGWDVVALEPDNSDLVGTGAIKKIKETENLNIDIVESFAESLPFGNESFELVYARQAMHHANDLQSFCNEVYRILKPGALFIATRDHVISNKSDLKIFLNNHPLHKMYGGENAYTLKEYKTAIINSGLKINQVLAPYDSDINLFPSSLKMIKEKIKLKTKIDLPKFLFDFIIFIYNMKNNSPGRLYSFICYKP